MASKPASAALRVFLSSPGDVADERNLARQLLKERLPYDPLLRGRIGFEVVSWDDPDSATPMPAGITPQEAVNRFGPRPSECDVVVIILWSRLGTLLDISKFRKPNGDPYDSGTEWEFEDALNAQPQPNVLIYYRTETPRIGLPDPDLLAKQEQYLRVQKFLGRLRNADGSYRAGYKTYDIPTKFQAELENDLKFLVRERLGSVVAAPAADVTPAWTGSPYPGLRPLTSQDAPIFFGRGREVDALIERLRDSSHRFLCVVALQGWVSRRWSGRACSRASRKTPLTAAANGRSSLSPRA